MTFLLTLQPVEPIQKPEPGQFFMVSIEHGLDPLLKRPFSLYRWFGQEFQILYRVVGKATGILKEKAPGNLLDVLGPLGNFYPMPTKNQTPLIVAGGIGIASLFFLAEKLAKSAYVLYGARTEHELFFINELKEYARDLLISTDDGSNGEKGNIIDVLKKFLTHYP
ncbi:MAG TPA: hypothetical protein DEP99_03575, partial [Nitrospiraceae bacterium]|nr:hypothetical protein [Nitrospiraceae bacterium]